MLQLQNIAHDPAMWVWWQFKQQIVDTHNTFTCGGCWAVFGKLFCPCFCKANYPETPNDKPMHVGGPGCQREVPEIDLNQNNTFLLFKSMVVIAGLVAFKWENTDGSAKQLEHIRCLTTPFICIDTVGDNKDGKLFDTMSTILLCLDTSIPL